MGATPSFTDNPLRPQDHRASLPLGDAGDLMKRVLLVAGGLFAAQPSVADAVDSAYALCRLIDSVGLASAPCEVSGWNSSVTTVLDMNSREARDLCGKIAGTMSQRGLAFGAGWTLQIQSPYSDGNSIAYCDLPK